MKKSFLLLALLGVASAGQVYAAVKPCDELKTEIAAKLDAKGVKGYKLDVVAADKVGDAKVVGSCNAGAQKVVYSKK